MKNKFLILTAFFLVFLLESVIIIQNALLIKNSKTESMVESVIPEEDALKECVIREIEIAQLSDDEYKTELLRLIQENGSKLEEIQEEISVLTKTYRDLLEEQKKKTIDTTAQETAVDRMKDEARSLYKNKNYFMCTKICRNILQYHNNDFEFRILKFKSLYYENPSDGSKYEELIRDYEVIKISGFNDDECRKIIKTIYEEKGIQYE